MTIGKQVHDAPITPRLPCDKTGKVEAEGHLIGNRRGAVGTQKPVPIQIGVVNTPNDKTMLEPGGQGENIPAIDMATDESAAFRVLGGARCHAGREAMGIYVSLAESDIAHIGRRAGLRNHLVLLACR
jgi:hypothetical protein